MTVCRGSGSKIGIGRQEFEDEDLDELVRDVTEEAVVEAGKGRTPRLSRQDRDRERDPHGSPATLL